LVIDPIQNPKDAGSTQATNGGTGVSVEIVIRVLTGDIKNEFLETLGYSQFLRPIYQRIVDDVDCEGWRKEHYKRVIKENDSPDEPLYLLQYNDYGTVGLRGHLRGNPKHEKGGDEFFQLVYNSYSSNKQQGMGGSRGFGKTVFRKFSDMKVVLYATRINAEALKAIGQTFDGSNLPLRLYGRFDLPSSANAIESQTDSPSGIGFFGLSDDAGTAKDIWGDQAEELAEKLRIERRPNETGTTITMVGFEMYKKDDTINNVTQAAEQLQRDVEEWWWPAISDNSLTVSISAYENDDLICTLLADPYTNDDILPFIECVQATTPGDSIPAPTEISEASTTFRVPKKNAQLTEAGHEALSANVILRLRRKDLGAPKGKYDNRVALIRKKSGHVVKYYRAPSQAANWDYNAVLMAGLAAGQSDAQEKFEFFLWAAEGPQHNDWTSDDNRRNAKERGYQDGGGLGKLHQSIRDMIRQLTSGTSSITSSDSLNNLSQYLSAASPSGSPGKYKYHPTYSNHKKTENLSFTGDVKITATDSSKPYTIKATVKIKCESGRDRPFGFTKISAKKPASVLFKCISTPKSPNEVWEAKIPKNTKTVEFEYETIAFQNEIELRRSPLTIDVAGRE